MIQVSRCTLEVAVALILALCPLTLLVWVYDRQVPESVFDGISARIYPDMLAYVWLGVSAIQLIEAILRRNDEVVSISTKVLRFQAIMVGVVIVGFAILNTVGYLFAAAFYVLAFAWLLNERGWAARVLAIITPIAVYVILNLAFEVRLPSILDTLWY